MSQTKFRQIFKQYMYYGIIAALVVVALVILPLIDTTGAIGWVMPVTPLGWIAYIIIRCLVGVITFLIFISFDEQGKVNILEDERYLTAYNKLVMSKDKDYIPLSPVLYKLKTRGLKGTTLAISMIITAFVVIEAILTYNYSILLAYGITIFMSLISGLFQMMKSSTYWTEEFPRWVDYHIEELDRKQNKEKEQDDQNRQCGLS